MLKTYSLTDVGQKRKLNQDYVFTSECAIGKLPNLFLVADGMGGHKAGDFASKYTVETIIDEIAFSAEDNPVVILKKAIEKANCNIRSKALTEEDFMGMGTTVVAATYNDKHLQVANVGDSRLYVIGKTIRQITRDHSLVEEMVRMGGIDRNSARMHPDKNIITRAIGAEDTVEIDFFDVILQKGEVVLMCSDGLSNMLEDEEIRMILEVQRDIVEKAEALVKAANSNGGKDNIAVIIIEPFVGEE